MNYASLLDYKNFSRSRGGAELPADVHDDSVITQLLQAASRYIDSKTGRFFYPYVETVALDVPDSECEDARALDVIDLLEVISLTNGDGVAVASTEYTLRMSLKGNVRGTPYNYIRLKDNSTTYWATDGAGDSHDVIDLVYIRGYHNNYSQAWGTGSTLSAAISSTSTLSLSVTSTTNFKAGQVIRIDNELFTVSAVATGLTVEKRGAFGSTAVTHLNGATITIWQPMDEIKQAVCEIVNNSYRRRFGQSQTANTETVTAAGVVLSPKEIPAMAAEFIGLYRRYL